MKFGLLYEIGSIDTSREGILKAYENTIAQIKLADELGFDYVWLVEHHFTTPFSFSIAPEVFLGALARETKNIRLGFGISVLVPGMNHPIKVAERTAVLDYLSGGRVDLGTGRSGGWGELGGFDANPHITKESWDEYVRAIPKMWTEKTFSHKGRFFNMPEREVVPKPYQDPHPPMWVAVTSEGTEIDAAERGLGSFGLSMGGYASQEKKINNYRHIIRNCDPVGSFVNEQVQTTNFMFCDEDPKRAGQIGRNLLDSFNFGTSHGVPVKEVFSSPTYQVGGFLPTLRQEALGATDDTGIPPGLAIGDPDRIIGVIKQWESIGVDGLNFVVQAMESVEQEDVLNSMRVFAREVMPKFKDQKEEGAAA